MQSTFQRRILPAFFLFVILTLCFSLPGLAQEGQSQGPVYVVQSGDNLWDISQRFGVSMDALQQANGIADPGQIKAGDELQIPGLEGIQGRLVTKEIPFGETPLSLSRLYQVPISTLARLNHLASANGYYVGKSLVIPEAAGQTDEGRRLALTPGQSLLELAVLQNSDPWQITTSNALSGTWAALPGDIFHLPGKDSLGPGGLPASISTAEVTSLVQGKTAEIHLEGAQDLQISGSLTSHPLSFFSQEPGNWVALQGIYAMQTPGLYPLDLHITLPDGNTSSFSQSVYIAAGDFLQDVPITVDPAGLDPAVTRPEDEEWAALAAPVTADQMWDGKFQFPAESVYVDCYPSTFGRRRSYNGSPYTYFHTGLDVCGGVGDDIYAAAAGTVVFAGQLTVRGNATLIDHGHGVYTGYMHQSEILVKAGDHVEAGQVIGKVGRTGLRITGPHLHFEVLVGDVQVDPMDWLQQTYP